jgi:iron complex transport system ATP-binding protein
MGRTPHIGILGTEKKYDLEIVAEILARIDLEQFRDRPIDELSAGERQRVLIAKALTQQPQLLLLDEPTAHLDIGYQIEILDLIKSLNAERKLTVICVLHDLNLASQYCDKLLLLDNGRIAGFAAAKDILRRDTIEKIFNVKVLINEDIIIRKPVVVPLREKDIDLP